MLLDQNSWSCGATLKILFRLENRIQHAQIDKTVFRWLVAWTIQIARYTAVTILKNTDPMQNAQAIFFGLGKELSNISNLKVYIDKRDDAVSGKLIQVPHDWPCFWTWSRRYNTVWFAFNESQPEISTLRLCVENDECKLSGMSNAMMISMAVYAFTRSGVSRIFR